MTDQSYQKARQLMADAYKAGYEGKPADTIGVSHPSLELQYLRGANHAKIPAYCKNTLTKQGASVLEVSNS